MRQLEVHFVNRGYNTDEGNHTVPLISFDINSTSGKPTALVKSPFGLKNNTLIAFYENNEWLCDLD